MDCPAPGALRIVGRGAEICYNAAMDEATKLRLRAADYRLRADECRTCSENASTEYGRDGLLQCARAFDRMAENFERLATTAAAKVARPAIALLTAASIVLAPAGISDCSDSPPWEVDDELESSA